MSKGYFIGFVISFFVTTSFSQQRNRLFVDFSVGRIHYKTDSLRGFMQDTLTYWGAIDPYELDSIVPARIAGAKLDIAIGYQPIKEIDIQIIGSFQNSQVIHRSISNPKTVATTISSKSIGIGFSINLDEILKKDNFRQDWLKKWNYSVGVSENISFSNLHYNSMKSTDFSTRFEIRLGYEFSKSPIFSQIGLQGGFQLLRTAIMKNEVSESEDIFVGLYSYENYQRTIRLDLSGFYYGIYLRIGK